MTTTPPHDAMLMQFLTEMKDGLSERMDRLEKNVDARIDRFEEKMAQYVMRELFDVEIRALRREMEESEKRAKEQVEGFRWRFGVGLTIGAAVVSATVALIVKFA